jgi:hypothetical protein
MSGSKIDEILEKHHKLLQTAIEFGKWEAADILQSAEDVLKEVKLEVAKLIGVETEPMKETGIASRLLRDWHA